MEVLRHVWELEEATVRDVRDRILEDRQLAYTTVMTVMKKLADKGYLTYETDGRAHVYRPARPPGEVRHDLLQAVLRKVFGGSAAALIHNLIEREELSIEDRQRIQSFIAQLPADDDAD